MTQRVPFASRPTIHPSFGEPQVIITIQLDEKGIINFRINKPLPAVQIFGLLLDCMQGQYQAMAQQASLLINPNRKEENAGKEEENHNHRGGDSSGGTSTV